MVASDWKFSTPRYGCTSVEVRRTVSSLETSDAYSVSDGRFCRVSLDAEKESWAEDRSKLGRLPESSYQYFHATEERSRQVPTYAGLKTRQDAQNSSFMQVHL